MSRPLHDSNKLDRNDLRSRRQHKPTSPIPIPRRLPTDVGLRWIHGISKNPDPSPVSTTSAAFTYVTLRQHASEGILNQRVKDVARILSYYNENESGCKYYNKFYTSAESYIILEGRARDPIMKAILDLEWVVSCSWKSPWTYDDGGEPRPYKLFRDRDVKVKVTPAPDASRPESSLC